MTLPLLGVLRNALGDAVSTETAALNEMRADKSGYRSPSTPLAVVNARSVDDVCTTLRIAQELRTPVVTRGAGTGLAGGATASAGEIVLSTLAMNRVLELSVADQRAVVEPGDLHHRWQHCDKRGWLAMREVRGHARSNPRTHGCFAWRADTQTGAQQHQRCDRSGSHVTQGWIGRHSWRDCSRDYAFTPPAPWCEYFCGSLFSRYCQRDKRLRRHNVCRYYSRSSRINGCWLAADGRGTLGPSPEPPRRGAPARAHRRQQWPTRGRRRVENHPLPRG